MKRKAAFKTMGCRLNQYETDALVTDFYKAGYQIVPFADQADVYVVNTCTVTSASDHKSKNIINQAVKRNKDSVVVVTGCMANSRKEWLEDREEITFVVENKRKSSVFSLVDAHFRGEMLNPGDLKQNLFGFSLVEKGFHTRSMIKIQEGCNNFCTYCIVPWVRGLAASRPVKDILHHIRQVTDAGFKEVVLTGVNISRYHDEGIYFEDLIEKILQLEGNFRLRISSLEPEGFGDKLHDLFSHPKMCPHLHLCLQSGSDRILIQMGRQYDLKQYYSIVNRFRKCFPDFNFTTDIITGFPGETDEDFDQTCQVVRDIGFSHIHTFKYSVRKGTKAAGMSGQIPENIKSRRSEIIRKIGETNKTRYRKTLIGKEQTVLIEKVQKGIAKGYGEHYVPVEFKARSDKNTFHRVKIACLSDGKDPILIGVKD
ncbi:MAG TPA: tRNA (N(6)-L-threonylcarbamoyladenosine(37)-C(2))-methylthiotransferase MtaB [Bacteroidales bacterium]|nr:tRNA (N(6)-L-threonylcarbamoyladenosine(37)-C(2))-methylthiotransferase MtaB [Bacteroidales bacterium]